jgi:hypothetical protein
MRSPNRARRSRSAWTRLALRCFGRHSVCSIGKLRMVSRKTVTPSHSHSFSTRKRWAKAPIFAAQKPCNRLLHLGLHAPWRDPRALARHHPPHHRLGATPALAASPAERQSQAAPQPPSATPAVAPSAASKTPARARPGSSPISPNPTANPSRLKTKKATFSPCRKGTFSFCANTTW